MKKLFVIMLVAILSLMAVGAVSATPAVCAEGGDWSSHQDPPLFEVAGAVEYCVKGGSVGAGGYLEYGTYGQVVAVVDGNDHDLSHWSYRLEEVEPTPTATEAEPTPTDVRPTPTATEVVEPTPTPTDVVEPTPTEVVEPTPTATPKPKKPPETGGGDVSALFVVLMSSVGGAALYFGARWSKKEM